MTDNVGTIRHFYNCRSTFDFDMFLKLKMRNLSYFAKFVANVILFMGFVQDGCNISLYFCVTFYIKGIPFEHSLVSLAMRTLLKR